MSEERGRRRWELSLAVVGAGLLASGAVHWVGSSRSDPLHVTVDSVLVAVPVAVLFFAALRLPRTVDPPSLSARVVAWTLATTGALLVSSIAALLAASPGTDTAVEFVHAGQLSVGVGSLAGLLVGTNEARVIERTREAEQAKLEAAVAEREQETIAFLNGLVRHHFLNGTNAIIGYADLLDERVDDAEGEHVHVIRRRARTMAALVEQVDTLADAAGRNGETVAVDLVAALAEAARSTDGVTDCQVDGPAAAPVRADGLLRTALAKLLVGATAGEYGPAKVRATVAERDGSVVARVEVNRPLPASSRASPFEPTWGEEGLNRYLAKTLVGRYGELTLERADDERSTFRLELDSSSESGSTLAGGPLAGA